MQDWCMKRAHKIVAVAVAAAAATKSYLVARNMQRNIIEGSHVN